MTAPGASGSLLVVKDSSATLPSAGAGGPSVATPSSRGPGVSRGLPPARIPLLFIEDFLSPEHSRSVMPCLGRGLSPPSVADLLFSIPEEDLVTGLRVVTVQVRVPPGASCGFHTRGRS